MNAEAYRDFEISPSLISYMKESDWQYAHKDYDGAPDAHDNRCGHGASIEDCKAAIDEWHDERDAALRWVNSLRILFNIEQQELIASGVIEQTNLNAWLRFRADPVSVAIRLSDERLMRLHALVERRQPRPKPVDLLDMHDKTVAMVKSVVGID